MNDGLGIEEHSISLPTNDLECLFVEISPTNIQHFFAADVYHACNVIHISREGVNLFLSGSIALSSGKITIQQIKCTRWSRIKLSASFHIQDQMKNKKRTICSTNQII